MLYNYRPKGSTFISDWQIGRKWLMGNSDEQKGSGGGTNNNNNGGIKNSLKIKKVYKGHIKHKI